MTASSGRWRCWFGMHRFDGCPRCVRCNASREPYTGEWAAGPR